MVLAFSNEKKVHRNSTVKLIDEMSLGEDALKVEGPIAQKGSIALEVTMATKRVPTTRHRHTERI